jgi:DNA-binding Lrp family transcriptional regulator
MKRKVGDTLVELDEIDRQIIAELQQDGRRTYGRIAQVVGLSEAAARQRAQRLIEAGVIRIVAIADPHMLGYRMRATLGIACDGDLDAVAAGLDEVAEADFVVATAGAYDLLVELQCEDDEHLHRIINDNIRRLPHVRRVESLIYLHFYKETYPWPPASA